MISTQVLQHSIDNQLKLYMKGSPVPVAQVTVNSLTRFSKLLCNIFFCFKCVISYNNRNTVPVMSQWLTCSLNIYIRLQYLFKKIHKSVHDSFWLQRKQKFLEETLSGKHVNNDDPKLEIPHPMKEWNEKFKAFCPESMNNNIVLLQFHNFSFYSLCSSHQIIAPFEC